MLFLKGLGLSLCWLISFAVMWSGLFLIFGYESWSLWLRIIAGVIIGIIGAYCLDTADLAWRKYRHERKYRHWQGDYPAWRP